MIYRIIDSALLEKFKNGEISHYSYINYPSYKEAVKTYDGKKYNVSCEYDISYEDNMKRVTVQRFLYMENYSDGEYFESGEPLAVVFDEDNNKIIENWYTIDGNR